MRNLLFATCSLAALAGCAETVPSDVASIAPTDADRVTPAYMACVDAIASQTGNSAADVAVFDYLYSEAGTRIQATIPGAEAPWSCLAANDGTIEQVMYTGSEGYL